MRRRALRRDCRLPRLPDFFPIRQYFPRPQIKNIEAAVFDRVSKLFPRGDELSGKHIGISLTSRGIIDQPRLLRACINALRPRCRKVSAIPAIGSHGGATAEGELQCLERLGITPAAIGAEILTGWIRESLPR